MRLSVKDFLSFKQIHLHCNSPGSGRPLMPLSDKAFQADQHHATHYFHTLAK
jgi:hypothetical protein